MSDEPERKNQHKACGFIVWSTQEQKDTKVLKFDKGNSSNGNQYHITFDGISEFTFQSSGMYKVEVYFQPSTVYNTLVIKLSMEDNKLLTDQLEGLTQEFSGACNYSHLVTVKKDTKMSIMVENECDILRNAKIILYKIAS